MITPMIDGFAEAEVDKWKHRLSWHCRGEARRSTVSRDGEGETDFPRSRMDC